jgi:hypothetical protein
MYENNGCCWIALLKQVNAQWGSEQHFLFLEGMEHNSGLYCKWVIRVCQRHDEALGS